MARYTRSLSVALSLSDCLAQLKAVLEGCNLEVLFSKEDCVIARETPGRVPFAKLVTIEVLVDSTRATSNVTNMDVVVKNEELPLQTNNHCSQIFDQLSQSLNQHSGWQVIAEDLAQAEDKQPAASAKPEPTPVASLQTEPAEPAAPVPEPALSDPLPLQTESVVADQPDQSQQPAAKIVDPQQQITSPIENLSAQGSGSPINLESMSDKQVQTTANLEELRQKRAESVANLERLRQKRAESIANLEKMRQKRERMFSANERPDSPGDDFNPLDLPEQPSPSQV